jgi:arylsulfatase B/arylsulfatase I/J
VLTGRYVFHHGVHVPFIDSSRSTLPLNETTVAERLQSAGYRTHMIGKVRHHAHQRHPSLHLTPTSGPRVLERLRLQWHLGFRTPKHTPNERGFESYFGYYAGSQDYWNHESMCWAGKVENGCFENETADAEAVTGLDLHNGSKVVNSSEYSTTLYTTEAHRIIAAHAAEHGVGGVGADGRVAMTKPLFLYLPHQAVHVGNIAEASHPEYAKDQAPAEYIAKFAHVEDEQRRNLSAMVNCMDEAAGNVTDSLQAHGLWQDTILIVSTDNGGPTGERASNYPLHGGKGSLWQGGVRGIGFVAGGDLASFGFGGFPRISHSLIHSESQ